MRQTLTYSFLLLKSGWLIWKWQSLEGDYTLKKTLSMYLRFMVFNRELSIYVWSGEKPDDNWYIIPFYE